jgi:hypothetical protein
VSDGEVVGEAGDGVLHFGKARWSSGGRDITARVSHGGMRDVGGHVDRVSCARRCVVAFFSDNSSPPTRKFFLKNLSTRAMAEEGTVTSGDSNY